MRTGDLEFACSRAQRGDPGEHDGTWYLVTAAHDEHAAARFLVVVFAGRGK